MSKDSGGFLRKVARFVAHPTTDWTQLDAPSTEARESEYAKTEIKQMIERKRRNDFVRKRELDMLRKIRREGLNQDNALALGNVSNLDSESRPQSNGARSDIAVKAKIDEIELQMVGAGSTGSTRQSSLNAPLSTRPGRLADAATTAANNLTIPATLAFDDRENPPEISQAVLDAARASMPRMAGASSSGNSAFNSALLVDVAEVVHDPDLDEAVIAFANADFDQCERCLLDLVNPGASRHDQPETWMVLFDFYRALELQQKFETLAVSYVHKFGVSPPQWYSLPQKVADFLAGRDGDATSAPLAPLPPPFVDSAEIGLDGEAPLPATSLEGWVAPQLIDGEAVNQLRAEILQMPRPWTMDWSGVLKVTVDGANLLGQLMRQWAKEAHELVWIGADHLLAVLGESSPTGVRDAAPAHWMLRLDILRLCNRPVQFDEVAIDYCVTYELSPPSWEQTACKVRLVSDAVNPHTRPLSHVSEVTTSFVESQLHDEVEFVQVAALNLSGQLAGDIGTTLSQLDTQLGASVMLDIDCQHLLRVDFIAAGDLLNWVLARRSEQREVIFNNPHRLVAMFFGAMGINEHAKVKVPTN